MSKYHFNPPWFVRKIFRDLYWQTSNNKILLTFDDGPTADITLDILNTLDEFSIKSLCFCVGENIQRRPEIAKEILNRGHEIGNHAFSHKILTKLSKEDLKNEIELFNKATTELLNYNSEYFRPPHGRFNLRVNSAVKKVPHKFVMWNLLTYDYKNDLKLVKFAVGNYLQKNSIIVLHDNIKSKSIIKESISLIVEAANKRGFEFGKPSECLK